MCAKYTPISTDPISWLLSPENPSVRYLTLKEILLLPEYDPQLTQSKNLIINSDPVQTILSLQHPDGWWHNPTLATKPMYLGTAWQLIWLAELAADISHPQIYKATKILLDTVQTSRGDFPAEGSTIYKHHPEDMLCFDGMLTWTLLRLGYDKGDHQITLAIDFLANSLLSAAWRCHFNSNRPCAWGGIKALRALAEIPVYRRSDQANQAIKSGAEFLLSNNLVNASFPTREGGAVSQHWFKFGFPRNYQCDILQTLVVLTDLGYAKDPRLEPAMNYLLDKKQADGTWKCEETITKLPVALDKKGHSSQWITFHAIKVLTHAGLYSISS